MPLCRLLVVTAVAAERDAVARGLSAEDGDAAGDANTGLQHPLAAGLTALRLPLGGHGTADLLAAGVGPAAAAAGAASALSAAEAAGEPYGLVVSAGIGGGFQPGAPVGSLVVADAIVAADLGAQTPEGFVPVTELGFGTVRRLPPAELSRAVAASTGAALGTVLTVSTVTGTAARAAELTDRHPDALAEAMEGFGVAEAAAAHGVPVLETPRGLQPGRPARPCRLADRRGAGRAGGRLPPAGARTGEDWREPQPMSAPLRIAYSPCPNDTFIFHAWAHGLLPGAPELEVTFADIDVTNGMAERGEFDVLKVSYAVLPWVLDEYALLPCGGALGRGCGPLVLTRDGGSAKDLAGATVAVPSERSTAYLLFRLWAATEVPGGVGAIVVLPFHEIMPAVRDGRVDAGLVIHEARFTYRDYGLHLPRRHGRALGADHRAAHPARRDHRQALAGRRHAAPARRRGPGFGARGVGRPGGLARVRARALAGDGPGRSPTSTSGCTSTSSPTNLGEDGYAAVRGLLTRAAAEGLVPSLGPDALGFPV